MHILLLRELYALVIYYFEHCQIRFLIVIDRAGTLNRNASCYHLGLGLNTLAMTADFNFSESAFRVWYRWVVTIRAMKHIRHNDTCKRGAPIGMGLVTELEGENQTVMTSA